MRILFVYSLSLIFFEGFLNLCYGGDEFKIRKHPKINLSAKPSDLPDDLIPDILFRAGFETTKHAAIGNIRTEEVVKRIFENYIIVISPIPYGEHEGIIELEKSGKRYLEIRNYDKLMRLFERFGKNVRKIHIYYHSDRNPYYTMDDDMRREINHNIIKKYSKQLTELAMYTSKFSASHNDRIWEEISNEKGEIHFPKVKKFKYTGRLTRNPFDVNEIFPEIEVLKLKGLLNDMNCLKNVRHLRELSFYSDSIEDERFANIIANNKQIIKLTICNNFNTAIKTVQSIAKNLKNLKTLSVRDIRGAFFVPSNNGVYNLTSVTSFSFIGVPDDLYENLSFDMPNLENLKLLGLIKGDIAKFINRFHKLKIVYLWGVEAYNAISCIKNLIHVKEYVTFNFEKIQLIYLKTVLEHFDQQSSKLNTIKWLNFVESEYSQYEVKMNEINRHLKVSGKPTWRMSRGYEDNAGKNKHYLMLKRDA